MLSRPWYSTLETQLLAMHPSPTHLSRPSSCWRPRVALVLVLVLVLLVLVVVDVVCVVHGVVKLLKKRGCVYLYEIVFPVKNRLSLVGLQIAYFGVDGFVKFVGVGVGVGVLDRFGFAVSHTCV